MPRDIVVIGASAGGVEAISNVVAKFPSDLKATVFVTMHTSPHAESFLPKILSRSGPLPASHPEDRETFAPGRIYVAPPDKHLIVESGFMRVVRGPKENRTRPAIDPLFRSAARFYGPRVIGVILSGNLDDGTAGLWAVKDRGGLAVVQDPREAQCSSMPGSAIANVTVDFTLPLAQIGPYIVNLIDQPAPGPSAPAPDQMDIEVRIAEGEAQMMHQPERPGTPSVYSCPECKGVLWEIREGAIKRFRCRVGHAFSSENMFAQQSEELEIELWAVLKTLEEIHTFCQDMARNGNGIGNGHTRTQDFLAKAAEAAETAETIRTIIDKSRIAKGGSGGSAVANT